jgi:outer membrane receptor protein involved in Fe transport
MGLPAQYFQGYGDPASSGSTRMASLFAQDRWRVSEKLTLEAGARYQWYALGTPLVTVSDLGGTTLRYDIPDRGDLAPRFAAAFDPSGRGRTMFHAAFGIFHDYPLLAIPAVTEIHDGVELLQLGASLPLSAQAWRSPGRRLPQPPSFPSGVLTGGPGFRVPFARTLSLGLDQEMRPGLKLGVDLLWVRGKRQIGPIDFNPIVPALGPGRRPNDVGGIAGTSATISQLTNYGESWYRGVTVSVQQRAARFEAQASYTLSKAEDLGNDIIFASNQAEDPGLGRDPANPGGLPVGFDPQAFRGPAIVDQRHRFVASAVAELPWRLRLSGIVTLASGRPYTALSGVDSNGNGLSATDRARRVTTDPASRVGRNQGLTPGFASVDVRLARRINLPRHMAVELLAEAFNLLNRANFSDVNNVFGSGAFPSAPQLDPQGRASYGRATKAYAPRQVQLAARLSF